METGYPSMNHKSCTRVRQICYFISNSYCPPAELVFIRPFCFDWHSFLQPYRYLFLVSLNEGTRSLCKDRQQSNSSSWVAKQIVRWLFRSPLLNKRRDSFISVALAQTAIRALLQTAGCKVADNQLLFRREIFFCLSLSQLEAAARFYEGDPRDKILTPL